MGSTNTPSPALLDPEQVQDLLASVRGAEDDAAGVSDLVLDFVNARYTDSGEAFGGFNDDEDGDSEEEL
jgi:hypothetical protein